MVLSLKPAEVLQQPHRVVLQNVLKLGQSSSRSSNNAAMVLSLKLLKFWNSLIVSCHKMFLNSARFLSNQRSSDNTAMMSSIKRSAII